MSKKQYPEYIKAFDKMHIAYYVTRASITILLTPHSLKSAQ